jgi:diphthine synthase
MLVFIGLGLYDERDLTLRGLEEAGSCDLLFMEEYTSFLPGTGKDKLESVIGREISILTRKEVEEQGEKLILEPAKSKKVGFLAPGDSLVSTTHVSLRLRAKELGIESRVVHNASISSAAPSLAGLQNYKFGRSASIPFPREGFMPEMPYDVLKENLQRGLHTLFFLDIKVEAGRRICMSAKEGIEYLLRLEEKRLEGVFTGERLCVILGNVGSEEPLIRAGKARELLKHDFEASLQCLIVPGRLHFMEEEYLRAFAGL